MKIIQTDLEMEESKDHQRAAMTRVLRKVDPRAEEAPTWTDPDLEEMAKIHLEMAMDPIGGLGIQADMEMKMTVIRIPVARTDQERKQVEMDRVMGLIMMALTEKEVNWAEIVATRMDQIVMKMM